MADLSPARVQALKDRPLRDFGYGFVGVSMSMDERDDLLAALEAQGQTIARLETENAWHRQDRDIFFELAKMDPKKHSLSSAVQGLRERIKFTESFETERFKRLEAEFALAAKDAELARLTAERTWADVTDAEIDRVVQRANSAGGIGYGRDVAAIGRAARVAITSLFPVAADAPKE